MKNTIMVPIRKALSIESECIIENARQISEAAWARVIEILATSQKIGASGCGHSGIACMHFVHLMCCIERPARFIAPSEAVHGATGYIQDGDAIILASRGGKTAELIPIMDICRRKHAKIVTFTENMNSPLALGADVVIPMTISRETDKFNCQGTTSFVVLASMFDALQAALIEYTGYRNEQFALIHPGGAVGERLNRGKNG